MKSYSATEHSSMDEIILSDSGEKWPHSKNDCIALSGVGFMWYFRHLFNYSRAELQVSDINCVTRRGFKALLLKLLGGKNCAFVDYWNGRLELSWSRVALEVACIARDYAIAFTSYRHLIRDLEDVRRCKPDLQKKTPNRNFLYLNTCLDLERYFEDNVSQMHGIIRGFYDSGKIPTVLSPHGWGIPSGSAWENLPRIRSGWNFPDLPAILANRIFLAEAIRLTAELMPQFIYHPNSAYSIVGAKVSNTFNVPLVLEYQGPLNVRRPLCGRPFVFSCLAKEVENANLRAAHLVVTFSDILRGNLINRGVPENRIMVARYGVDSRHFYPIFHEVNSVRRDCGWAKNSIVIGVCATANCSTGAEVFAAAIKKVYELFSARNTGLIKILLIGQGPFIRRVLQIIDDDIRKSDVHHSGILGFYEVQKYLSACDILVAPDIVVRDDISYGEPPKRIVEYMATGRAVVAPNVKPVRDVLSHTETGYLFTPGNSDSLAEALAQLIEDSDQRAFLGETAKAFAMSHLSWKKTASEILDRLSEISR